MHALATALAVLSLLAQQGTVALGHTETLRLPHTLRAGEAAFVILRLGAIGPGQQVEVTTASGRELGTISPHGMKIGQAAGSYVLPVPRDAILHDRIAVRIVLTGAGVPRAPDEQELRSVKLTLSEAKSGSD